MSIHDNISILIFFQELKKLGPCKSQLNALKKQMSSPLYLYLSLQA